LENFNRVREDIDIVPPATTPIFDAVKTVLVDADECRALVGIALDRGLVSDCVYNPAALSRIRIDP